MSIATDFLQEWINGRTDSKMITELLNYALELESKDRWIHVSEIATKALEKMAQYKPGNNNLGMMDALWYRGCCREILEEIKDIQ